MNYRHTYHAGNFADAFKHIVLLILTKCFLRKENAFCFLDTHAGIGRYDLLAEATQKSREYVGGIEKIALASDTPSLVREYIECVKNINSGNSLQFYPGSPEIVKQLLRP